MAVQCAGIAFDCVFNVAKKETRSWTENRGRILCSSNATWKPRIWFLPWIKSQPKIDGAYIVFVKSLYEFFSSHRICIHVFAWEPTYLSKTLLTSHRVDWKFSMTLVNLKSAICEWTFAFSLVDCRAISWSVGLLKSAIMDEEWIV